MASLSASRQQFEVVPEIELGEYKGVEVPYLEPEVADSDIHARLGEIREAEGPNTSISILARLKMAIMPSWPWKASPVLKAVPVKTD